MNESSLIPVFASKQQFNAAYQYVSDPVCLFCPNTGKLLAGNPAFWQKAGPADAGMPMIRNLEVAKEGEYKADLGPKGKEQKVVRMQVSQAKLEGNERMLGIFLRDADEKIKDDRLLIAEAEKKALLNEVYHRVKNNLNIIISLLSLQINRISNPEMRLLLLESKSRIFTLSLLQQNLYNSPRISEIEVRPYFHSLATSVLSTFKPREKEIHLVVELEEVWLDIETLTPLGLIAHELISNVAVHAFKEREKGQVNIGFQQLANNIFQLKISDNGVGLPQAKDVKDNSTLGFELVKSLCKQLNGKLVVESGDLNGTSVSVEFKRIQK